MTMKPLLYTSPGSQHCRRVALLIAETAIPVDTRIVDVRPPGMGGENESPEFLQLNPNAKVPVLTHGEDLVLNESNAIMCYLCELHGDTPLWPADTALRAQVLAWQFWQAAQLSPVADALMVENMLRPMLGDAPDPQRVSELVSEFHRWASVLDARLSRNDYLAGDGLTCADLAVASALMYVHAAQLPLDEHDPTSRWFRRICDRPSWRSTEPPPMKLPM